MTKDDIIRMAREAKAERNPDFPDWSFDDDQLQRCAALVAAAERNKVAAWMIERSYATGHGDTTEDLLKELEWQVRESEREACAKVAFNAKTYIEAAAAIRARGQE